MSIKQGETVGVEYGGAQREWVVRSIGDGIGDTLHLILEAAPPPKDPIGTVRRVNSNGRLVILTACTDYPWKFISHTLHRDSTALDGHRDTNKFRRDLTTLVGVVPGSPADVPVPPHQPRIVIDSWDDEWFEVAPDTWDFISKSYGDREDRWKIASRRSTGGMQTLDYIRETYGINVEPFAFYPNQGV